MKEREMKDESDANLVGRFRHGEEKAFNQLVLRYQKRIYDLTYRMVRNHQDAADLSMEVFVRAYKGLAKFEERSSFYVWLAKIAVNLCINFSRQVQIVSFTLRSFGEAGCDKLTGREDGGGGVEAGHR